MTTAIPTSNEVATLHEDDMFDVLYEIIPNRDELVNSVKDMPVLKRCGHLMNVLTIDALIHALSAGVTMEAFARFLRLKEASLRTWITSNETSRDLLNVARDQAWEGEVDQVIMDTLQFEPDVDDMSLDYHKEVASQVKVQGLKAKVAMDLDNRRRISKKEVGKSLLTVNNNYHGMFFEEQPKPVN